jgi:hypothetical protein
VDHLSERGPEYRTALVQLLAGLAYGEFSGFMRLAADARLAPTLSESAEISSLAVHEYENFVAIRDYLAAMDVSLDEEMAPFVDSFEEFHQRTQPKDWLESVVKAYVGDAIAIDFFREIASYLDPTTADLVRNVAEPSEYVEFAVATVRQAITRDPAVGGRLALWGRRLVGEALAQAQRVFSEQEALAGLLIGQSEHAFPDLAEVGRVFARLTTQHTERMERMGLQA